MHRPAKYTAAPEPAWVEECRALTTMLITQGLTSGVYAMAHTPGLTVDPFARHDVLRLAALRFLTSGLPGSATVDEMVACLTDQDAAGESR